MTSRRPAPRVPRRDEREVRLDVVRVRALIRPDIDPTEVLRTEGLDGLETLDGLDGLEMPEGADRLAGLETLAGLEGLVGLEGPTRLAGLDGLARLGGLGGVEGLGPFGPRPAGLPGGPVCVGPGAGNGVDRSGRGGTG